MQNLPTITSLELLIPNLKIWQHALAPTVNIPPTPRPPFNFRAVGGAVGATGVTLQWEIVQGADGYQIQSSNTGDFSNASIIATTHELAATSWFDSTISTGVKRYYRIRATSGTTNQPQTIFGQWSAPISNSSGSNTTVYDSITNTSGRGGWSTGRNPGIGPRLANTQ